jgi:hypothetical protein
VKSSQNYSGADAEADYNLVAMGVEFKLEKLKRAGRRQRKWDTAKLKINEEAFRRSVESDVQPSNGRREMDCAE